MMFRSCYENSHSVEEAKTQLAKWYEKVAEKDFDSPDLLLFNNLNKKLTNFLMI
jgi:mRNA-degrading endonuclease HigB of HigAB toxin-antitoxin module